MGTGHRESSRRSSLVWASGVGKLERVGEIPQFPFSYFLSNFSILLDTGYGGLQAPKTLRKILLLCKELRFPRLGGQTQVTICLFVFVFVCSAAWPWRRVHSQETYSRVGQVKPQFSERKMERGATGNQRVLRRSWRKGAWENKLIKLFTNPCLTLRDSS